MSRYSRFNSYTKSKSISMPNKIYSQIKEQALKEGILVNHLMNKILENHLEDDIDLPDQDYTRSTITCRMSKDLAEELRVKSFRSSRTQWEVATNCALKYFEANKDVIQGIKPERYLSVQRLLEDVPDSHLQKMIVLGANSTSTEQYRKELCKLFKKAADGRE